MWNIHNKISSKVIGVFGFPGSGKTTFVWEVLYPKLQKAGHNFFIQRANPDADRPLSSKGKLAGVQKLGGVFNEEFVNWVIKSVESLRKQFNLVYLDCGGMQSEENKKIIEICDEAIVIGKEVKDLISWRDFILNTKNIPIKFYLSSIVFNEVNLSEDKV